jgi:hypothetical protein
MVHNSQWLLPTLLTTSGRRIVAYPLAFRK